uniref:RIMS-binding protein 2 n=1 Tax=Junco hyemalis TaxID=40217 RepID=A0A8C5JLZ3_JUNHY
MREAAERRQQLELEHEQALAVLNAKQQEIELLQKAQVEAKKEHEGAVQLLEAKVRELEQKCRTQSEQFKLLSRELERFRQQAGTIELLGTSSSSSSSLAPPGPPGKALAQLMNGIATSIGKGHESPSGSRCVISEFIRPLQVSGDKPEQLSVKPTFLSKSRSGTPRCRFDSDMDNDQNSNTSKQRYSGKVHLCIARYSYNPFDGPNENPEAELPLTAGKYLYVYGDMDEDGFYEGELLDGQRGLVPSNFVDFVQDSEARLSSVEEQNALNRAGAALEAELELSPPAPLEPGSALSNGAGTLDVNIDEIGEDIVPYPRRITLIKQLAKSVIVGWEPPLVPPGWGTVSSYNVLVDKEVRMNIALGSRTKALIEKLNTSACTYRISIQSITSKGSSDELQCTLLVGKDVIVAPSNLRVDNITQISAELSWLPTNSNYSHVIFLNEEEFDIVKAASYKYHFFNLKPNMAYKVKVMAKPHQMPWQLPLEQREKKEAFVEFSTLPAGPPAPPQEVCVRAGSAPGTLQVCWKPPALSATGTSHGATVTGYAVYAKGQRVSPLCHLCHLCRLCPPCHPCHPCNLCHSVPSVTPVTLPLLSPLSPLLPWSAVQSCPPAIPLFLHSQASPSPACPARTPSGTHPPRLPSASPWASRSHPPPPRPSTGLRCSSQLSVPCQAHYCLGDEYHTESSRGSDLSDILEEDEEELYSEMQLEEGGRRRLSLGSHGTLKEYDKNKTTEATFVEQPGFPQQTRHSKRLFSIPEVAEEDGEYPEVLYKQGLGMPYRKNPRIARGPRAGRPCRQEQQHSPRRPGRARAGPGLQQLQDRGGKGSQALSRSPDSGLDCGSEEEEPRLGRAPWAPQEPAPCPCRRGPRPPLSRRRTLTRQSSIEEDFGELEPPGAPRRAEHERGWRSLPRAAQPRAAAALAQPPLREAQDALLLGNPASAGRPDRVEHAGRRSSHGSAVPQRSRPLLVPSIDGYGGHDRLSPDMYEESETDPGTEDLSTRIFVALFDYDPLTMSPNPDAAEEELPFKEGQIIKVYGDKDADGFYRGETCARVGLIPCNMVSEIQADDEEMMDQLLKQGFLPLNTPIEKIAEPRGRRGGRQQPLTTRRMVALYDYDPRESSPNVDVEAELTFCTGDIITVFGEIDEDGFYYGELNGHKGLVPSNFLEEVPDDVEVFLSDAPARYAHDAPMRAKAKRKKSVHFTP